MRIISIIAIAILTVVVGCNHTRASRQERQRQDARERPFSWQDESILLSDRTTPELSALANESGASEAERAVAVFGLWAKHIRPVCASAVFRGVLSNTNWLRDCPLHKVRLCSGWIPVDMASGDSVFALTLFPSPSDNGATLWTIYFRLTGNVEEGDARAFLTGAAPAGSETRLVEFALCFPHSASPGHLPGRVERFSSRGIHVYSEWAANQSWQPMPGDRLVCFQSPLARRGCTVR